MESLDGLAELHMSGARAVFEVALDSDLAMSDLIAAIEGQGLTMASFDSVRKTEIGEMYLVDAGVT